MQELIVMKLIKITHYDHVTTVAFSKSWI